MEAELDEIGGEPRLGRGDPEVGDQRQAQARADRRALHRGDDRLRHGEQPHRLVIERIDARPIGSPCPGSLLARSAPAQKLLPSDAQHDGAAVRLGVERLAARRPGRAAARPMT